MDLPPQIPWPRLVAFVRQHTHDIRNHLNGLDLEAALLSELVTGGEAKSSVDRLRRQIRDFANEMRTLSAKFADPPVGQSAVPASILFLIWKDQLASLDPKPEVTWNQELGEAKVTVDPDAMAKAFRELLANAVSFGGGKGLRVDANAVDGHVSFTLTEPKKEAVDPSEWGKTPLNTARRGAHGMGLWTVDRNVSASHGAVSRRYDAEHKELVTTLTFPKV